MDRLSPETIESRIFLLRGQRVMLDADLAKLYHVQVKAINQAVKRNVERFPADFMFQLTWDESERSRSQVVTLNGGRKLMPPPVTPPKRRIGFVSQD